MRTLTEPLRELDCYLQAEKRVNGKKTITMLTGCVDSQKWHMTYGLSDGFRSKIIVTYSDIRVKEIYEDYRMYDKNVRVYPSKDLIFYQADVHGNKLIKERIASLKRIAQGLPCTIITTFSGLMTVQAGLEEFKKNRISISSESLIDERKLSEQLTSLGYEKTYQVETNGQFSVRGGIVDIFDLTEENPFRIELWGDEVSSIRSFDVLSQRSIEKLESITIYPASELPLSGQKIHEGLEKIRQDTEKISEKFRKVFKTEEAHRLVTTAREVEEQLTQFPWTFNADSYIRYFCNESHSFIDFFQDALIVMDEPGRISEHAEAVETEFRESMKTRLEKGYILPAQADVLFSAEEVSQKLQKHQIVLLSTMEQKQTLFKPESVLSVSARSVPSYNNSFPELVKDLKTYHKNGYRVVLLSGSKTRAQRLATDLMDNDVIAFYSEDRDRVLSKGEIMTCYGRVLKGFEYPQIQFVVISESDIFGTEKKKKKAKKEYDGKKINDFNDLKIGDYVVHESHGLGIYRGIEKVEAEKVAKDYMKIEYKDGGVLYVLATGLDVIMKYASADAKKPKLNSLSTKEWSKTTEKVRTAVNEVADDLVALYANRREKHGFEFGKDTVWQREFEELFPYEETKDQLEAIEATKQDMESNKIMDRLICGDVGYGKTEIAIRAAFKAVQDGKQVAFLVPTTILAQQHYNTFIQRMKDFPVRVELLSRFVTKSEQNKTLTDLQKGTVDIVIGTHRILSKDLKFKDLGLLIVDEEQRFGVTHKEKIKQMKENVDVLTLTATPIPRTLHMSLIGIRDMSVLEEAPNDRLPIQTYVMEYNDEMVREAICRELARKGQVYYVYNRVNNISDVAAKLQTLVPEANVAFAHGQMKESELERIMYDFIRGDIDVLVSTTIIETGIDIPNVNTMIIHDSENLGLSQLYQLRGRVGRSSRTAYAFLMYKRDRMLKEVAEKRLQAIREFTDLGSGFKIAMRDLEIRGAGNILGMSQHGHMAAVGYDLYCKMLNAAVLQKKGIQTEEDFTTFIDLDVDAFIPLEYILNEVQKLDIYKRIAGLANDSECEDMKEELKDRFGDIPECANNLLRISMMRVKAHKLFMSEVKGKNGEIRFTFRPDARINAGNIDILLHKYQKKLTLSTKGIPIFTYRYKPCGEVSRDENMLKDYTEQLLGDMTRLLSTDADSI